MRLAMTGALLAALSVMAAPASHAASFTTVTAAYGADPVNQSLTVYEPGTSGPHPAVLFVHGGCWARGTLSDVETALAQDIANRTGWVVATMTYRETSTKWSTMPADVDAALHKLQTGGYGVDASRVALWGESAGGHLALLEALKGTGGPGVGRAKAVVSISGPVDMRTEYASDAQVTLGCIQDFEGGLPSSQAMLDRYASTSPVNYVDKSDPAVFLGNAVGDPLVPVSQPAELAAEILAKGGKQAKIDLVASTDHSTAMEKEKVLGGSTSIEQAAIDWLGTTL